MSEVIVVYFIVDYVNPINMISPITSYGCCFLGRSYKKIRIFLKNKAIKSLNTLHEIFKSQGLKIKTKLLLNKPPKNYLKDDLKIKNNNLVILSYKEKCSKLRKLLNNSPTQKILKDISCDILILK